MKFIRKVVVIYWIIILFNTAYITLCNQTWQNTISDST